MVKDARGSQLNVHTSSLRLKSKECVKFEQVAIAGGNHVFIEEE